MIDKADRSIQSFVRRLEHCHLSGGPPAFCEICVDIASGHLVGTYEEFVFLWELLVKEAQEIGLVGTSKAVTSAISHVVREKNKARRTEIEPELFQVRARRRR